MKKIYLLIPALIVAFVTWKYSQPQQVVTDAPSTLQKKELTATPTDLAKPSPPAQLAPKVDEQALAELKAEVERQGFVKVEVGVDENGHSMIKTAQWPTLSPEDLSAKVVNQFKENREQIIKGINGGPVEMTADEAEILGAIIAELPEAEQ